MLYIVSTPIGNLKDITLRALEALRSVDLIACEDTRHTKILLSHYNIDKPTISYHSYSGKGRTDALIRQLEEGKNVALVSDAGTPGISDPGYFLVREAIGRGIPFTAIPGPSAFLTALTLSGINAGRFIYRGFLSPKQSRRRRQLEELKGLIDDYPVVIYESPHRILKLLGDIGVVLGQLRVTCVREATKKFEEVSRGTPDAVSRYFAVNTPKGEFAVVIENSRNIRSPA